MRVQSAAIFLLATLAWSCTKTPSAHSSAPPPKPVDSPGEEPRKEAHKSSPSTDERPGCLPITSAKAGVAHVELQGRQALACYLNEEGSARPEETYPCVRVDLDAKKVLAAATWSAGERAPASEPTGAFELSTAADSVQVCPRGSTSCSKLKVRHKPAAGGHGDARDDDSLVAAVNADGSRVFVFASELRAPRNPGQGRATFGDLYEVKTGKRLSRVDLAGALGDGMFVDPSNIWRARFVGANVLVEDHSCCGPGGSTALVDPEKQRGRWLHGYDGDAGPVAGSTYWVRDGKKLGLIDVSALTELATFTAPGESIGDPERAEALVALDAKTLVLAHANPPGVVLIDLETKAAGTLLLPLCE